MIDKEDERRGEGEEGRTQEEQDRAAEGGGTRPRDPDEPRVPSSIHGQDDLIDGATDPSEVDKRSGSPAHGRPREDG